MEYYWLRNTETSLARLRRVSRGVAALPLASLESHGPHLPLGSDPLCIEHVMRLVLAREPVAVLPTLVYSSVAEARMLPGAINVRGDLLMDLVENLCDEVNRNGFPKIALIHGHGGNAYLHQAFTKRMLEREKPYAVYSIPVFADRGQEVQDLLEHPEWGHACEFETSLNLAACPELVDLNVLGRKTFPTQPGPDVGASTLTPADWTARHPKMAVGRPQLATRRKGEAFARIWAEGIADRLRRIKRDRLTLRALGDYRRRCHAHKPKQQP